MTEGTSRGHKVCHTLIFISGGTVDTTGHQVLADGTLKEIHAATGGPWGGQLVNEAFERFIEKLVGFFSFFPPT